MNSLIQALSLTEIFQSIWEDAKVKQEKKKSFYSKHIIWGHSPDALQYLSETVLTAGPILAVYYMQQLHKIICLFSKHFQFLYIFVPIFKYFTFLLFFLPFF